MLPGNSSSPLRGPAIASASPDQPAHGGDETVLPLPADPKEALRMHGSWLRAVAIARLRGLEGADDVMQDVAMAAIRNWATLRTAANAKPWLYRLTVRAALMHRRTLGRARKRIAEAMETYTTKHGASEAAKAGAGRDDAADADQPGFGAENPLASLLAAERH